MKAKIQVEIEVPMEKPTAGKLSVLERMKKHYRSG